MAKDDFYVGYLPLPEKNKKFLKILIPLLTLALLSLPVLFALSQNSPKDGVGWDPEGLGAITVKGVILKKPYDLLRFQEEGRESIQTAIITSMTKTSVTERVKSHYHKPLLLRGVMIRQDGRFVFSLLDDDDAIQIGHFNTKKFLNFNREVLGPVNLQGEIVDPKCYIGAMKPGGGKVHKSCAVLCIRGGIPPMFVTRRLGIFETYSLIVDEHENAVIEPIIPYVGDLISITGIQEKWDDLLVLKLNLNSIKRL